MFGYHSGVAWFDFVADASIILILAAIAALITWVVVDRYRPYARTVMVAEGEPDPVPPKVSPFRRIVGGAR